MSQKARIIETLPKSLQNLIQFLIQSQNIKKIVLFGSRARNNARENSDYDIAVWVSDRNKWPQILSQIEEKNITLLPVDLVLYDEISPEYKANIDKEGVIIYDQVRN